MQIRQIMMTPEHAQKLLAGNYDNRKMRERWADEIAKMMRNGEWRLTHQAIAVAKTGRLLDGQHRLKAVVQAGVAVPMMIAENCDAEIFSSIDQGVKRSVADSLNINKKISETLTYLLRVAGARAERPSLVKELLDTEYGYAAEKLFETCSTTRRGGSSASIKAAATAQMVETGRYDLIARNYKNFINLDYDKMTKPLLRLEKQLATGAISTADREWLFCRAYRAFDPKTNEDKAQRMTDTQKAEIMEQVGADVASTVTITL